MEQGRHASGYVTLKVIDRLPLLQQAPHATSWLGNEFVNNPKGISPLFRAYRGPSITGYVVQGDDSRKKGHIQRENRRFIDDVNLDAFRMYMLFNQHNSCN